MTVINRIEDALRIKISDIVENSPSQLEQGVAVNNMGINNYMSAEGNKLVPTSRHSRFMKVFDASTLYGGGGNNIFYENSKHLFDTLNPNNNPFSDNYENSRAGLGSVKSYKGVWQTRECSDNNNVEITIGSIQQERYNGDNYWILSMCLNKGDENLKFVPKKATLQKALSSKIPFLRNKYNLATDPNYKIPLFLGKKYGAIITVEGREVQGNHFMGKLNLEVRDKYLKDMIEKMYALIRVPGDYDEI